MVNTLIQVLHNLLNIEHFQASVHLLQMQYQEDSGDVRGEADNRSRYTSLYRP
jgi:hypothetical protein